MSIKQGNDIIAGVSNPFSTKDIVEYTDKNFVTNAQKTAITHTNRTALDKISETDNKPTYNALPIYAGNTQYAEVNRLIDQVCPSATTVPISHTVEILDTNNIWTITSPTRFTVSEAGYYTICAAVEMPPIGGDAKMSIVKNGVKILSVTLKNAIGWFTEAQSVTTYLAINDYVEVQVIQWSGSNKTVQCFNFSILKVKD